MLNFFHWLGAVVTNPMIIGNKWTPVRKVVDRAGAHGERSASSASAWWWTGKTSPGLFTGTPEGAWDEASELSKQAAHHLQGQAVSHGSLLRAEDV